MDPPSPRTGAGGSRSSDARKASSSAPSGRFTGEHPSLTVRRVIAISLHQLRPRFAASLALAAVALVALLVATPSASGVRAKLVRDIARGGGNSYPEHLTEVGRKVFFTAKTRARGRELWRSNGTRAGTKLVRDIRPGSRSSEPNALTNLGGTLFFAADDGIHGEELWRSDGTRAGTKLVRDIRPGSRSSWPFRTKNVGGTLLFAANDGIHGSELWRSDGTEAGTTLVRDIRPGPEDSSPSCCFPSQMRTVGGTLLFAADDGIHGEELWRSDGTEAGTTLVRDINQNARFANGPWRFTSMGGILYFYAVDRLHGDELWRSDGTEAGTTLVRDIHPGPRSSSTFRSNIGKMVAVDESLLFAASDGTRGLELWRSDGTEAGTRLVRNIMPGRAGSWPRYLTNFGGRLLFTANDGKHGDELWRSNGNRAGTKLVRDISPGRRQESTPADLTSVGRMLFFSASGGTFWTPDRELWRSDGTRAGTKLVRDIKPGAGSSKPNKLTRVGRKLFFTANDGAHGRELWKAMR